MKTERHSMDMTDLDHSGAPCLWPASAGRARVLLIGINVPGYYSLPVRILALVVRSTPRLAARFDARYVEWSTDDDVGTWADRVADWHPDVVGLSMNIWNRTACAAFAECLKGARPDTAVLVGGQEATFSVVDFLREVPAFDYVIDGEGEIPFQQFLESWDVERHLLSDPEAVSGLRYRQEGHTRLTRPAEAVASLDEIPSPILEGLVPVRGREGLGVLLEGARGCPFRCAFCFEGAKREKVRTASVERLADEARFMAQRGATYFHMMDPILCNSNPARLEAMAKVFRALHQNNPETVVSVEAYGDRITDEMAACFSPFMIVDVGLQTVFPPAVKAIHRAFHAPRFRQGVARLRCAGAATNIYLISGLPHETFATFLEGVRFSVEQRPTKLFCNELLLLNGTELRRRAEEFGYVFDAAPPYRVHANRWVSRKELCLLQAAAKNIEKRYNLSLRAVAPNAPWIREDADFTAAETWFVLPEKMPDKGPAPGADLIGASAVHANTAVRVGARPDLRLLRQFLGQLRLAGAERLKIAAPPVFFEEADVLRALVGMGVFHFTGFMTCADFHRAERCEAAMRKRTGLETGLDVLSGRLRLGQDANIRPYMEIATAAEECTAEEVRAFLRWACAHGARAVALADDEVPRGGEWVDELRAARDEAAEAGIWIRFPKGLARDVFGDLADRGRVLEYLELLGLLAEGRTGTVPGFTR